MPKRKTGAVRGMILLLIALTGIASVPAGPLVRGSSIAFAQQDASQQVPFRLVGTVEGGPLAGAVIDDTKNPQAFYRLHDKLPDNSRIVSVLHNHIVLRGPDGAKIELYTTPGTGGGRAFATPVAATPSDSPQRVDQPTPEESVAPPKRRTHVRTNPSAARDQNPWGAGPPPLGGQAPGQRNAMARDADKRTGNGGTGMQGKAPSTVEN